MTPEQAAAVITDFWDDKSMYGEDGEREYFFTCCLSMLLTVVARERELADSFIRDALDLIDVVDGSGGGMLYHEPYKTKIAAIRERLNV